MILIPNCITLESRECENAKMLYLVSTRLLRLRLYPPPLPNKMTVTTAGGGLFSKLGLLGCEFLECRAPGRCRRTFGRSDLILPRRIYLCSPLDANGVPLEAKSPSILICFRVTPIVKVRETFKEAKGLVTSASTGVSSIAGTLWNQQGSKSK